MSEMFDFGFTAVDEEELEAVQKVSVAAESTEDRLHSLYNAIIPLLNNLKQNPEKDYIYWPNRSEILRKKIEELNIIQKNI